MSIKKFAINENDKWMDTDLTLEQVTAKVESEILPQIESDLKEYFDDITVSLFNTRNDRDYLTYDIKIDGKAANQTMEEMGLIGHSIKSCSMGMYGQGGYTPVSDAKEKAVLQKTLWFKPKLGWEMQSGGTNGGDLYLDGKQIDWIYNFETQKLEKRLW